MDAYIGTIMMWAADFAPQGWAFCNGQLLPIGENSALYSLIGTTYGGDGTTTFGLPRLGKTGGSPSTTATEAEPIVLEVLESAPAEQPNSNVNYIICVQGLFPPRP